MLWETVSRNSKEGHQERWHAEHTTDEKQLGELGLVSLEKRLLGGSLTATLSYLKGGSREDSGRLLSEVCSKRTTGNRHISVVELAAGHRKVFFHHQDSQTQNLISQTAETLLT